MLGILFAGIFRVLKMDEDVIRQIAANEMVCIRRHIRDVAMEGNLVYLVTLADGTKARVTIEEVRPLDSI